MRVQKAITILRTPEETYRAWRDFESLPRFMFHLERVEDRGNGRSHWWARKPGGGTVEWEAQVTDERPNESISWASVGADDDVKNSGVVRFERAPGDRGTEVHVELSYDPPAGKLGAAFAKLMGEEPALQLADELRRFKQVMELGEVVRSSANPEGVGEGVAHQHAAQPESGESLRRRAS